MKMDEKAIKAAMQRMGIQSQDVDAHEVIIRTSSKDIVISNPHVTKVNMMGQLTFQIMGNVTEKVAAHASEEDVSMVSEQAHVSKEEARKALEESNNDIAAAIMLAEERKQ